ncbi:hypothetical protein GFD24_09550 [Bifidobacterium ramosum]|uniref:Uncharacterized protein n=1 Tax=Bifidobacterium ramosum TaxID=1798158 RepID=A0A7K3TCY3_9BIFI|nr:hypothetical protein [Bifidobacterium ramosum]
MVENDFSHDSSSFQRQVRVSRSVVKGFLVVFCASVHDFPHWLSPKPRRSVIFGSLKTSSLSHVLLYTPSRSRQRRVLGDPLILTMRLLEYVCAHKDTPIRWSRRRSLSLFFPSSFSSSFPVLPPHQRSSLQRTYSRFPCPNRLYVR